MMKTCKQCVVLVLSVVAVLSVAEPAAAASKDTKHHHLRVKPLPDVAAPASSDEAGSPAGKSLKSSDPYTPPSGGAGTDSECQGQPHSKLVNGVCFF